MSQVSISVMSGGVGLVKSDAIITTIGPDGIPFGCIDGLIKHYAGDLFHKQVTSALPLCHGQTVVAKGGVKNPNSFSNVVFVIDDLEGKFSDLVYAGLVAASEAGFSEVVIPTIRAGVALGTGFVHGMDPTKATNEMMVGVHRFIDVCSHDTSINKITIAVFSG